MAKFRILTELARLALCNFGLFWPSDRFSDSRTTPLQFILQTCTSSFFIHTKVRFELLQLIKFPILAEKSTVVERADKSQICPKFAIPTQKPSSGHRLTLACCWSVFFCLPSFGSVPLLLENSLYFACYVGVCDGPNAPFWSVRHIRRRKKYFWDSSRESFGFKSFFVQ